MSLTIAPIGLRAANAYVTDLHRHHGPTHLDPDERDRLAGWRAPEKGCP